MRGDGIYEDIQDIERLKGFMVETLEEYNNTPGVIQMDLVLFRDAIEHGTSHALVGGFCRRIYSLLDNDSCVFGVSAGVCLLRHLLFNVSVNLSLNFG